MNRALIAIGVKKTGDLPELQAALDSAVKMARWAKEHQRIPASRVKLITDEKRPVTRERIFKEITAITKLGFVEQLIVYFSGHGINAGHHERWLLSGAPEDPGAAVNVLGSEFNARFCGIAHVVFVSDACRTAADSIQAQGVTGGEIFPNQKPTGPEKPVDQFFAALVGNPAYETRSVDVSAGQYLAAYSTVLLGALLGNVPDIIEASAIGRIIRPRPLKRYLSVAVPDYLGRLNLPGGQTQQPDARIESDESAWIGEVPTGLAPGERVPPAPGTIDRPGPLRGGSPISTTRSGAGMRRARGPGLAAEARDALAAALRPGARVGERGPGPGRERGAEPRTRGGPPEPEQRKAGLLERATLVGATGFGPDHFETQCGIKIRGAEIRDAYSRFAQVSPGVRLDVVQVALAPDRRAANVFVRLADGSAVLVPAFRGYIASLSCDAEGNLDDFWYEPSANTPYGAEYAGSASAVRELRAVIAAASSFGVFRLDDEADARDLLDRMRSVKSLDPAMAIYAAYAMHDRRMRSHIVDMQRYLDPTLKARIFDVAMLAFSLGKRRPEGQPFDVYPCVPMLTQGWALLSPLDIKLQGRLKDLRGHLRSSLWTHFNPEAAGLLLDTLQSGKVG